MQITGAVSRLTLLGKGSLCGHYSFRDLLTYYCKSILYGLIQQRAVLKLHCKVEEMYEMVQ